MKEDVNIEKLFKQKFENFEADVDSSAWTNIRQGINGGAGGGSAGGGMSMFAKVAIFTGIAAATTVGVWYFSDEGEKHEESSEIIENTTIVEENNNIEGGNEKSDQTEELENDQPINNTETNNQYLTKSEEEKTIGNNEERPISLVENENQSSDVNTNDASNTSNDFSENTTNDAEKREESTEEKKDNIQPENNSALLKELKSEMDIVVKNQTLTFDSHAENFSEVLWDFGDGNVSNKINGVHTYDRPGTYTVVMEVKGIDTKANQIERDVKTISIEGRSEIVEVPNVFTPNGDNDNDFWNIKIKEIKEITVLIQDKKGKKVFESKELDFSWDGSSPDGRIYPGTYGYIIIAEGNDGEVHKKAGTITLTID